MSNGDAGPAQPGPFDVIPSRPVLLPKLPPSFTSTWPVSSHNSIDRHSLSLQHHVRPGGRAPIHHIPLVPPATYTDLTGCAHCHDHSNTSDTRLLCKHARTRSLLGGVLAVSWMLTAVSDPGGAVPCLSVDRQYHRSLSSVLAISYVVLGLYEPIC